MFKFAHLKVDGERHTTMLWLVSLTCMIPDFNMCVQLSHVWLFATPWNVAHQAPLSLGILQAKNTRVGSLSLLQGILPTQELNQGFLHCKQILYQLSFQESPCCQAIVFYFPSAFSHSPKQLADKGREEIRGTAFSILLHSSSHSHFPYWEK